MGEELFELHEIHGRSFSSCNDRHQLKLLLEHDLSVVRADLSALLFQILSCLKKISTSRKLQLIY